MQNTLINEGLTLMLAGMGTVFVFLTALVIAMMIPLGLWMTGLDYYDAWYKKGPDLHRAIGILLGMLILVRLLARTYLFETDAEAHTLALEVVPRLVGLSGYVKDRVVYLSDDAAEALDAYLKLRRHSRMKKVFLVEKGRHKGRPISVRGIQKRLQYYAQKSGLQVSCHQLRHTMATQMLNADAALVTIQELLGHSSLSTTQVYTSVDLAHLMAVHRHPGLLLVVEAKAQRDVLVGSAAAGALARRQAD